MNRKERHHAHGTVSRAIKRLRKMSNAKLQALLTMNSGTQSSPMAFAPAATRDLPLKPNDAAAKP